MSSEDGGTAVRFNECSLVNTHTQGHTGTHLWSVFLPAPLSSVPANEERANEGQWGDEAVGGCGSEVAKEKDRARDKEMGINRLRIEMLT